MMNKKKILVLTLSLFMVLTLAACGNQNNTSQPVNSGSADPSGTPSTTTSYPKSTITIVCPWDPGGSSDGLCRTIAEVGSKSDYFGVNMVVQNTAGAGGTVATTEFKNSAPDGYTIFQEAIGVFTLQP